MLVTAVVALVVLLVPVWRLVSLGTDLPDTIVPQNHPDERIAPMKLEAGQRLRSACCSTQIIVVRPPASAGELTCGGVPMVELDGSASTPVGPAAVADTGTKLGKRYIAESPGLEVLCTQPGEGSLAFGGEPLEVKSAKPLPSSD